ncbi:MAG TPA: hypothetical protein V6D22_01135 [Candidatus Obscuribacterales bacterium]
MNSTSRHDPEFTKHTHELLDAASEQALAYAEKEFGVGHPIWQSIHDQVACFCKCSEECAAERGEFLTNKPRSTH